MQPLNKEDFLKAMKPKGRLLAIDHGKKRIGLALSDVSRQFANPLEVLTHLKFAVNAQAIAQLIEDEEITGIILGYPLNMDDTEGPRCQSVRQFARNLEAYTTIPMLFWDERLSSDIAQDQMLEGKLRASQRGSKIDKLAALAILESFLTSR